MSAQLQSRLIAFWVNGKILISPGFKSLDSDAFSEHIHVLSQEALDHADLTVLNAAIGAAALIKNSLFIYLKSVTVNMQAPRGDEDGSSLKVSAT